MDHAEKGNGLYLLAVISTQLGLACSGLFPGEDGDISISPSVILSSVLLFL